VQIGGGVRVGDAFQAIVGSNLIANEDRGSVSKFLKGGAFVPRSLKTREIRTGQSRSATRAEQSGQVKTDGLRNAA
jgi:hypothetical protein